MPGLFEVDQEDLTAASGDLSAVAEQLTRAPGQVRGWSGSAFTAPGAAGVALAGLVAAWQGATDRLAEGVGTYAMNTQAAAVLYEQADNSSTFPAPPPPAPSPPAKEPTHSRLWYSLHPQPVLS